jgi:hypothetical protein
LANSEILLGSVGVPGVPAAKRYQSGPGKPPPGARREFQQNSDNKNDKKGDEKSNKSILMGSGLSGAREEAREA